MLLEWTQFPSLLVFFTDAEHSCQLSETIGGTFLPLSVGKETSPALLFARKGGRDPALFARFSFDHVKTVNWAGAKEEIIWLL